MFLRQFLVRNPGSHHHVALGSAARTAISRRAICNLTTKTSAMNESNVVLWKWLRGVLGSVYPLRNWQLTGLNMHRLEVEMKGVEVSGTLDRGNKGEDRGRGKYNVWRIYRDKMEPLRKGSQKLGYARYDNLRDLTLRFKAIKLSLREEKKKIWRLA